MAGTNQLVPFGVGAGANVLTPGGWNALGARQSGFAAGIASSQQLNTAWRQGSLGSALLGSFIADHGYDALDDGDIDALVANFEAALVDVANEAVPGVQRVHFGQDTGPTNAIVATVSPAITAYEPGAIYNIRVLNANTGPATARLNNLAAKPVVRSNGLPARAGDYSRVAVLTYDATFDSLVLVNLAQEIAPPGSAFTGRQSRFGYMPVNGQTSSLEATFTTSYAGVVMCIATLNSSPQNGNISTKAEIVVDGQLVDAPADSIAGATTSIAVATVPRSANVTVRSSSRADQSPIFTVSQYLTYIFAPG